MLKPTLALLQIKVREGGKTQTFACGATIVDEKRIITAAHCLFNDSPEGKKTNRVLTTKSRTEKKWHKYKSTAKYLSYIRSVICIRCHITGWLSGHCNGQYN